MKSYFSWSSPRKEDQSSSKLAFKKLQLGGDVVGGDAAVDRVGDVNAGDACGRMGSCEFAVSNAGAGAEIEDPVRLGKRIGQRGEMEGLEARDEDGVLSVEAFRFCRGLTGEWIDTFMFIEMFSRDGSRSRSHLFCVSVAILRPGDPNLSSASGGLNRISPAPSCNECKESARNEDERGLQA